MAEQHILPGPEHPVQEAVQVQLLPHARLLQALPQARRQGVHHAAVLLDQQLQLAGELPVALHRVHGGEPDELREGVVVRVVNSRDVRVDDDDVGEELQVHQPPSEALRQLLLHEPRALEDPLGRANVGRPAAHHRPQRGLGLQRLPGPLLDDGVVEPGGPSAPARPPLAAAGAPPARLPEQPPPPAAPR